MIRPSLRWIAGAALLVSLCAPVAAQVVVPPGSSLDVGGGSMDISCTSLDLQGTLNLGGGTFSSDSNAVFASGSDITGTGGTISLGGNLSANGTNTGDNTLVLRDGCNAGNTSQLSGTITVQNLVLQSTTGRTFVLPQGANITVLGALTLQGTAAQPVQLTSSGGTAVINLGPNATVTRNFANVPANVQIGAVTSPAAIPTLSEYGLVLLSLLLAAFAFRSRRDRTAFGSHSG